MKTKQIAVNLPTGVAHLFVSNGCGEIQVCGFCKLADVEALRGRLDIQPQFMGAWDCKDGTAAIDYRVPVQSWYLHDEDKPTVQSVVRALGRRWSDKMIAGSNVSDPANYAIV